MPCDGILCVGLLCLLASGTAVSQTSTAQPSPDHLAIRASDIETKAKTTAAGTFLLDSALEAWLYVPPQCVGTRCPLLVYLHGAGMNGASSVVRLKSAANRYGLLVLGPSAIGTWWDGHQGADLAINKTNLETALRETGKQVAVDARRIAMVGECNGGSPTHHWGFHNLDLFSRIGTISGELWDWAQDSTTAVRPLILRATRTQFYVQESIVGGKDAVRAYRRVHELRENGNMVKYVVSTHGHGGDAADFMLLGHWLSDSWATGNTAHAKAAHAKTSPTQALGSLPVVTPELAAKAIDAITKLAHEDPQVRETGRRDYAQEFTVPVGEQPTVLAVDLASLAKKYPVVATDLQSAGITAQQYNASRLALIAALLSENLQGIWQDPQGSTSVLGQNMAFVKAQPKTIEAMHGIGFFEWP